MLSHMKPRYFSSVTQLQGTYAVNIILIYYNSSKIRAYFDISAIFAATITDFCFLAIINLKRSKSVIAALRFFDSNFFAQDDFSHVARTSCSYMFSKVVSAYSVEENDILASNLQSRLLLGSSVWRFLVAL